MISANFFIDIFTSLIANGLTELINYSTKKAKSIFTCKYNIKNLPDIISSSIQDAATTILKNPSFSLNGELTEKTKSFLESPTAENIVRQIYSDTLCKTSKGNYKVEIEKEFKISFAKYLGKQSKDIDQLSEELFEIIFSACDKALEFAIDKGVLPAHELKSIERFNFLQGELKSIEMNLHFLLAHSELDIDEIKKFEERYRSQVGERWKQITIPHFDRAPRIEIDKIFVNPNFIYTPLKKEVKPETISIGEFLARLHRVVLLGDPGGGKSTLAQKICYDLCKNYDKRLLGGCLLSPVLVVLRDYSVKKEQEGLSIIQFIEKEATSKYQLPTGPPSGAFEYLFNNGHLFVIFDGLDELLDPSHRREISADIESFCNLFPSVPVLVTSRIVGYEQAPLNSECFEIFHIAPFNDKQISEYIDKWFSSDPTLTEEESRQNAKNFLSESKIVSDLCSNPLMLALMCNLYKGAGFIPNNRPEVYKKCSEMFLERWDPSRGISARSSFSEPKVLLGHLANWIYSDESLQSGVPESKLIKESTKFLKQHRFESEEEAEKTSKEFLDFCRGRAWIFTDVGTTSEGEKIYKFTHKTFLEYFTACDIVRKNNSPNKLWKLLKPKIANRSWDEVAQLSFQMLHEQVENASDKMLRLLIKDSQQEKKTYWSYLSFGARCLQFIFPSPKIVRALTEACIMCVIERNPSSNSGKSSLRRLEYDENKELIGSLLFAACENRPIITDSIRDTIISYAKNENERNSLRAIDLGLTLHLSLYSFFPRHSFEEELYEYWRKVEKEISNKVGQRLYELAQHNFLAFSLYRLSHPNHAIEELFKWYKPDYLFMEASHVVFGYSYIPSIAEEILRISSYFNNFSSVNIPKGLKRELNLAAGMGEILLTKPLFFLSYKSARKLRENGPFSFIDFIVGRQLFEQNNSKKVPIVKVPITNNIIIGAWYIWAVILEVTDNKEHLLMLLKKSRKPFLNTIYNIFEARIHQTLLDDSLEMLNKFNLSQNSIKLIEKWTKDQISFVRSPTK